MFWKVCWIAQCSENHTSWPSRLSNQQTTLVSQIYQLGQPLWSLCQPRKFIKHQKFPGRTFWKLFPGAKQQLCGRIKLCFQLLLLLLRPAMPVGEIHMDQSASKPVFGISYLRKITLYLYDPGGNSSLKWLASMDKFQLTLNMFSNCPIYILYIYTDRERERGNFLGVPHFWAILC